MKGIAIGLTILALGFAACGFVTGQIINSTRISFLQAIPFLPMILYGLGSITLILDIFAIYKAATYKGY